MVDFRHPHGAFKPGSGLEDPTPDHARGLSTPWRLLLVASDTLQFLLERLNAVTTTVFTLPGYRIGPYEMRVVAAERDDFADKRRKVEADWTACLVRIDRHAQPRAALGYFLRHLVTAIHYRSGLNDSSDEESFTHSLSTGLVELARSNPLFWEAFMELAETTLRPGAGWIQAAGGFSPDLALRMPRRITHRSRGCQITTLAQLHCDKAGAYGFYTLRGGLVELSDGLQGANLAVVAIHEVLHFLHECEGLDSAASVKRYREVQARTLLRFWKDNPTFWRWWLSVVNPLNPVETPLLRAV